MGIGTREMVIFLVIVLIIFGPKNLPRLAKAMGQSVRELKNGLSGLSDDMRDTMNKDGATPTTPRSTTTAGATPPPTSEAKPVERTNENNPPRDV